MRRLRRVGVFIPTAHHFGQKLRAGINKFCQVTGDWKLVVTSADGLTAIQRMGDDLDGVILEVSKPQIAQALEAWGKPCVDVVRGPNKLIPRVVTDARAMGRIGAEHLLELGFRNFAYCGVPNQSSHTRLLAYKETLQQAFGSACRIHEHVVDAGQPVSVILNGIAAWVRELPKPIAVMANVDGLGLDVIDACREHNIRVPDQVAVLGVGDDTLVCERANPMLSSIDDGAIQSGFQAAALLHELMAGKAKPKEPIVIPPVGVICRASTDALPQDSPYVAMALRYIRDHACDPIQVENILTHVPMSRRSLERQFAQVRGRSPHEEIRRVQLQRATLLLARPEMSLDEVSRASGFGSAEWMNRVFHKSLGMTPGEYRRRYTPVTLAGEAGPKNQP